ncbi:MAG: 16S rRNA (guanine(527)-N(7))-methyltransferase RsmG [Treponema sp.]|jgi:16S rRNA (guanine527-N7)-methyltransferase|nr:16S rRNA (guanine(527)-N(7))-methyltransferase RsmG [Treponema sp.]
MSDPILEQGIGCLRKSDPAIAACLDRNTPRILSLLNNYIEEIERFNPAYGLVGAKNRRELVVKHILDSLSPLGILWTLLKQHSSGLIGDVGSGAGLPGIPLAICLVDYSFVLIERMERRSRFLSNTLAVLRLPNAAVETVEMERASPGRFRLITFRAFKPLEPALLKALFRLLEPEGVLAAYKGRRDTIEAEMGNIEHLLGTWEAVPVKPPFLEEERHLVVMHNTALN